MYTLCLKRKFIARHFLIGGDWGRENEPHAHGFEVELRLKAGKLDRHGYLVDLLDVETILDAVVDRYRDTMLNDQPPFAGKNPSLERFCRILWDELSETVTRAGAEAFSVRLWENEDAWAEWDGAPA